MKTDYQIRRRFCKVYRHWQNTEPSDSYDGEAQEGEAHYCLALSWVLGRTPREIWEERLKTK